MVTHTARPHRGKRRAALAALAACGLVAGAACSPGEAAAATPTSSPKSNNASNAAAKPTCGKSPVTMNGYFETGFPLPKALTDEFTKQFPKVTWNIREDQFAVITQNAPRVLADNPPDLMRLPQMSELAKDGLLLNLDDYAKSLGWDKWPASQLEQLRVAD